jgi:N-methylhydantoinase A/oxoprolinase/acetone carboxylase beta subunit
LGIDTGGTYTDAVLLDYDTHEVLSTHKSLTTKRDFAIGIENVIEGIHIDDPAEIKMVSVSTTLATNAIAEGKGKRVGLFLIGYDPELIDLFQMSHQFATPNYYYFSGGHDLFGAEKEPLDLKSILEMVKEIKGKVDALAVSSYFSPLNPDHENRAFQAISSVCDLPIVLGHQLSTKLGSVERATTAALNASLLSVLQEFIIAVRRVMENRKISAPLMVVRGDGTLMSDEFAARTPVETIHSGPAASAIGGFFLSSIENALILDVGGTTTDLALIIDGSVTISEKGAKVSEYKTAVKAANLLSIGLGGDSHIYTNRDGDLLLGPERVVPLAYLASQYPKVKEQLRTLTQRSWDKASPDWLEYWYLIREPDSLELVDSDRKRKLVDRLKKSPRAIPDISKELGIFHVSQLDAELLFRQEIIGKAGFTPTDLMHIENLYNVWDVEAAQFALGAFSNYLMKDPQEVQQLVWEMANEMIMEAVISFVTGKSSNCEHCESELGAWFFHNSIYHQHPHLNTSFQLAHPVIGIGGPANRFLEATAQTLHTDLVLPDHFQVANAVGAIAGSIMVAEEILIYPKLSPSGLDVVGYVVQSSYDRLEFDKLEEALTSAREMSREYVVSAAVRSGAANPEVIVNEKLDGIDTYRIHAQAVGKPRLS